MKNRSDLSVRFLLAMPGLLLAGRALAQFPQGQQSGASPQSSGALVTLAIPSVLGISVAHNFVLDFNSGTKCWGSTSSQGTFPQAASGSTSYTFAVSATSIASSSNVACPGAGAQADVGMVQVFSTASTNSRLQANLLDGGQGAQATKLSDLIADVFTSNRLKLAIPGGDTCGGGTKTSPMNLGTASANEVTAIPATGWGNCQQTLSLTLASSTAVVAGTATGTLTFTIVNP
jgi:hypothetical protein